MIATARQGDRPKAGPRVNSSGRSSNHQRPCLLDAPLSRSMTNERQMPLVLPLKNGDTAGPDSRCLFDFLRKENDLKAERRQLIEIRQFLQMAIADLAAGLVTFPDDRGVARPGEAVARVAEGGVPAPAVGSGQAHPLLEQEQRRLPPHAAAAVNEPG